MRYGEFEGRSSSLMWLGGHIVEWTETRELEKHDRDGGFLGAKLYE